MAWEEWNWSPDPLPRDRALWIPQFSKKRTNARQLALIAQSPVCAWPLVSQIAVGIDLLAVGNTTILRTRRNEDGHWHLSGGAIGLAELFALFGRDYTVSDLMCWYHNAPKVVRKRPHAWGSPGVRDAAHERRKAFG